MHLPSRPSDGGETAYLKSNSNRPAWGTSHGRPSGPVKRDREDVPRWLKNRTIKRVYSETLRVRPCGSVELETPPAVYIEVVVVVVVEVLLWPFCGWF